MKLCKRAFALLLVLCMVVPMCLFHVSADVVEKTTDPGIKFWSDTITGTFAGRTNTLNWAADYKSGKADVLPLTWKTQAGLIRYNYQYNDVLTNWSGWYLATPATPVYGIDNWFAAFMIRNPGEGSFKVSFDMVKMSNTASEVSVYAIPSQGSDELKNLYNGYKFDMADANAVNPYLMEAQRVITDTVKSGKLATKLGTISPVEGMEDYKTYEVVLRTTLESKAADGDYIIVVVPEADPQGGTTGKCTIFLEGMTVTKSQGGSSTPTPTTPAPTTPAPTTPAPTTPATPTTPVNPGTPNEDYSLFHSSLAGLSFDKNGGVAFSKVAEQLNSLYASGAMKAIPMASKADANMVLNYSAADTSATGDYKFDGIKLQKAKVGDYVAIKFKSPGAGNYSIVLEHFYLNANNAAAYDVYVLPGNTAESQIASLLTEDNKVGSCAIENDSSNARTICTSQLSLGVEMEANADYILVLAVTEDKATPENNRVDMMFTALSFGDGLSSGSAAFDPVEGEVAALDIIKVADYYRAAVGVNPANGHDLMYLLFKGNTMLVYDLDAKEMIDEERLYSMTPFSAIIDDDNNLWISGSGTPSLQKYDPRTGEISMYTCEYEVFQKPDGSIVKTNAYGLTPDGNGNLYFGYYGWIGKLNTATGEFTNVSGTQLSINGEEPDGQFAGYGGMVYKDGYLYIGVDGDLNKDKVKTDVVVKYDVANKQIVDYVNVSDSAYTSNYGINDLNLMGDLLIGTFASRQVPVYIDISGEKMQRVETMEGNPSCFIGDFTDPINGKVYIAGYVDEKEATKCIYEYDPETRTARRLGAMLYICGMNATGGLCTIDGDDRLTGQVIATPYNNPTTGMVDIVFYNPANEETVIWECISEGYGTSADLRDVTTDPTGRYVVTGAYGTNLLAIYDIQTGETRTLVGHSHQTDSLHFYGGYLWVGNYSLGSVTRVDLETGEVKPLFNLMETVFQQKRMFALTAGDNKVFCGTVPDTGRFGGALLWYDIDQDLTYVAAGPEPDQVYYAKTTSSFVVWRNALTDEVETFDVDGDGQYDFDFLLDDKGDDDPSNDVKEQRFNGVIPNQCINDIVYKDGYIIGTTTKSNGMNVGTTFFEGNAQLFVYDVAAMKLAATYDISQDISGLDNPEDECISWLDGLEEDPYEPGKFWGSVSDTLYSFTVDFDTMTFSVKEELSLGKGNVYKHASSKWHARSIVFEGDYLYVTFHTYGTFMVNTSDPSDYTQVSATKTSRMTLGGDGNLYYFSNMDPQALDSICVFKIADVTQPLVAQSVQAVIDALPETVTIDSEVQIMSAYAMYNDLPEGAKALVSNVEKLNAAMAALEPLQAAKADSLIDAIGEVTLESETAILAARRYYDSLTEGAQAKVTKLSVLEAAEAKLAELKEAAKKPPVNPTDPTDPTDPNGKDNGNGGAGLYVIIAVAAVVVIAAVVVVILLSKKKKAAAAPAEAEEAAAEPAEEPAAEADQADAEEPKQDEE